MNEPDSVHVKRAKVCERTSILPDSDDFVDDCPRPRVAKNTHTRDVKGKDVIAESNKTDGNDADAIGNSTDSEDDNSFPSLVTRSSPAIFVKAVSGLLDAQRRDVRDMGLGSLLELSITATPLKMGFWIVNNFNHLDRKLHLYDGEKVHVKEDDVHATLGLPRGEIDIRNKKKRATSDLLDEWVRLFNVRISSNITASKVLDKIRECEDGGDWFKRHFIVLMVTCLFESSSNGMANFRIVHMLDDLTKVCNMNWCSYMIRCLVDTKRSWDSSGKQKKYTGPLLFMTLFYVDKVVLSMRSVSRSFPIFLSWTNESLKNRERDKIASGGFGRGYVDADMHVVVDRPKLDIVEDVTTNDNEVKSTMEPSVQAYVQEFASKTQLLATIGDEILQLVKKAPQVLVGDENFMKIQGAAQKLLGFYTDVPKAHLGHHDQRQWNHTVSHERYGQGQCEWLYILGIWSDDDDVGDAHHQHTSGIGVCSGHNEKDQTVEKSPDIDVQTETVCEVPRGNVVNVPARPKRDPKAGSAIKSPFMKREIDVTKKLDAHENMAVKWVLRNDPCDELL
ncbi:Unknown protein [Striga hermonthica]|uniref:Aminotransferase-like plant mobile domain-containing protein n=1 Tax=Striga hermonthica TaxID=68872 RepID=A0A9N7R7W6_STRHE|nr:Unknown protein [Striga hermonthica]